MLVQRDDKDTVYSLAMVPARVSPSGSTELCADFFRFPLERMEQQLHKPFLNVCLQPFC